MPQQLADTVDALLSALNDGRADAARPLVRPEIWDAGDKSPAAMAADPTLLLQAFPGMLEVPGRAAVRVMGFYKEGARTQWWFFFDETADGWILASFGTTRLDAERFLKGAPTPEPAPAPAEPQSIEADEPFDEEALRAEVKKKLAEAFSGKDVSPQLLEDLGKLPKDAIEKMMPELVGGAMTALFESLLGQLKTSLDEAATRDAGGTIDLDRERAKRSGKPMPEPSELEKDVSREVRGALRDALHAAASEEGEAKVDSEFLRAEGPRMLGSLLGAVFKAVAPTEIAFDVPPEPGKEGAKPTKVKVELGDLFGKLFAEATPAPNREGDDEKS